MRYEFSTLATLSTAPLFLLQYSLSIYSTLYALLSMQIYPYISLRIQRIPKNPKASLRIPKRPEEFQSVPKKPEASLHIRIYHEVSQRNHSVPKCPKESQITQSGPTNPKHPEVSIRIHKRPWHQRASCNGIGDIGDSWDRKRTGHCIRSRCLRGSHSW